MKKILISLIILLTGVATMYATTTNILTKVQQIRLNNFIKQLKIPSGEYKLTVNPTGTRLETYIQIEPQVITKEVEIIKEVVKEVPVEKIVTVEKVVEKPMSACIDLSKANPNYTTGSRYTNETVEKIRMEIEEMKIRNQMFGCP